MTGVLDLLWVKYKYFNMCLRVCEADFYWDTFSSEEISAKYLFG